MEGLQNMSYQYLAESSGKSHFLVPGMLSHVVLLITIKIVITINFENINFLSNMM